MTNNNIKNVLICGLGGLGCICATNIKDNSESIVLKILVDETRYNRYKEQITYFNDKPYKFDIIKENEKFFKADLIIIATKNDGLAFAIKGIKNFIHKDTIILSLLNGIHSENAIKSVYKDTNVITSFYLGHSCTRNDRSVYQDGIYNIVLGSENKEILNKISYFFDKTGIKYKISPGITDDYWGKFMINVGINQLSATTGLTLKEIKQNKELSNKLKSLMNEVRLIAKAAKMENYDKIYENAVKFLFEDIEDAKTSMLQDIQAKRKTEIDIFAGEVIKLGKKYNIPTPLNKEIYEKIIEMEKYK